jgi:hypothetical protein
MFDVANTWPFSAGSDLDFFVAFVVLSGISMGLGVLCAMLLGDAWDGPVRRADASTTVSGGYTSVGLSGAADTFLVGRLPRGDEVLIVAYLKGLQHLESALFAMGTTAGWFRPQNANRPGVELVLADVTLDDPLLASAKSTLANPASGATWQIRLRQAASRMRPELQRRAETMNVARAGDRRSALVATALCGVVGSVALVALRFTVSDDPSVLLMSYYVVPIGLFFSVMLTIKLTFQHKQARAYLRWLDESVDAIRDDVKADRADDQDVVLIAALDGMGGLGAAGKRLGVGVTSSVPV